MKSLVGQPVFRVEGEQFYWEDVAICGALRGDWAALERETREGQACLRRVRAGHALPAADVDAAAAEFRYARDLVAAEETVAWLERWGLARDEWMDCIRRSVARRLWSAELPRIVADFAPPDADVSAAMQPDALCSGRLRPMAEALARRAAARAWLRANAADASAVSGVAPDAAPEVPTDLAARGLPDLDAARLAERGAVVADLERALARFRAIAAPPPAIEAKVAQRRLDWIRFESRVALFAREEEAREAALCIREDGLDLAEVAADAHVPLVANRGFLDQAPKPLRDRMLAAGEGDVVGPVELDGKFALIRIDAKRVPSAADPEVARRAEREVVERALAHAAQDHVHWQVKHL